jgi:hypothetical protein
MPMKCGLATPEWASKHEFHVVLTLCRSLAESPSGGSRVETLWRTILGDTSLDGQHPAPRGLAENLRIFVTVFAGIYILKAGLHVRDETAARDAIASALNELKCGSELPSIEDVDNYLDSLKPTGRQVPGDHDYALYMQQMPEIDDAGSPFLSKIHLIATARRFFTTGRGNRGLGPNFLSTE